MPFPCFNGDLPLFAKLKLIYNKVKLINILASMVQGMPRVEAFDSKKGVDWWHNVLIFFSDFRNEKMFSNSVTKYIIRLPLFIKG